MRGAATGSVPDKQTGNTGKKARPSEPDDDAPGNTGHASSSRASGVRLSADVHVDVPGGKVSHYRKKSFHGRLQQPATW